MPHPGLPPRPGTPLAEPSHPPAACDRRAASPACPGASRGPIPARRNRTAPPCPPVRPRGVASSSPQRPPLLGERKARESATVSLRRDVQVLLQSASGCAGAGARSRESALLNDLAPPPPWPQRGPPPVPAPVDAAAKITAHAAPSPRATPVCQDNHYRKCSRKHAPNSLQCDTRLLQRGTRFALKL